MKFNSTIAALCIALAAAPFAAPAFAGPSGQHSAQALSFSGAASAQGSAAVSSGAATVLAVPIIVLGAGIVITGSALAAVGEGSLALGSEMIEAPHPRPVTRRAKRSLIVPDGPPTLD